jgi:bifunctional non-homologous end joining protein LigD
MGISVPVAWSELSRIEGGAHWSVKTAHLRVAQGNDPWAEYRQHATSLKPAMKRLSFQAPTP